MGIRILIVDDHKIVREGLRNLIEKRPEMEVISEAEDGRAAVKLAKELLPDIIIMDVAMPEMNGIEATRQIIAGAPHVKIIALSMHSNRRFIVEILKEGASGYLLKDCAFDELVNAINTVLTNRIYLSPRIADIVIKEYINFFPPAKISVYSALTHRECEVLQLLAEGKSTKDIASRLNLSVKTVETHRQQIMDRLGIHSVAELTKYAIREGLTSL